MTMATTTTTTLPLDSPHFLTAKRVTGLVKVPESDENVDGGDPLDLDFNASVCSFDETAGATWPMAAGPPALKRRSSLNGNILWVDTPEGQKCFLLQRKIDKAAYESVRVGFLLHRDLDQEGGIEYNAIRSNGPYPFEMVGINVQDKDQLMAPNTNSLVSAQVELAALQLIAQHDKTGEGCVDRSHFICADAITAYVMVPFHGEGSLFQYVVECGTLSEPVARHYFRQILTVRDVVFHDARDLLRI